MVRRLDSEGFFFRLAGWSSLLVAPAAWGLFLIGHGGWQILGSLCAAAFLFAARIWLMRQRDVVKFWFPLPIPGEAGPKSLAAPTSWSTVLWCFAYAALWMLLLGLMD